MTNKQQLEFKAMRLATNALIAQVDRLTNDLEYMAGILDEIRKHPALSIPPLAVEPAKAAA